MDNFLIAILAGAALASLAAPLGCFVIWRRMAYFGDGLSHSALLGVAFSMAFNIASEIAILIVGIGFATFLVFLQSRRILATDTLLGLLAHATLAIGILAMSLLGSDHIDMHDYLLGSVTSITSENAIYIILTSLVCLMGLIKLWPGLLLMVTSEDLAQAEGINVRYHEAALMVAMALLVAASIQLVGILLITSLLIIPASCARLVSKSPETMALNAGLIGISCVVIGMLVSRETSLDPGPVIVAIMVCLFIGLLSLRLIPGKPKA